MAVQLANAQVVYTCDFEDGLENSQWVRNAGARGAQCESKWFIGKAGAFPLEGDSGLYVSSDSLNAVYQSSQTMYVVTYREMTLQSGSYNIDFDWRGMGNGRSAQLVVAWVPQTQATNSNNSGSLANWATTYRIGDVLYGSKTWKPAHQTFTVTSATEQGKLVFIWSSARDVAKPPSGCVDNIVISVASQCSSVTNLTYTTATATLSWSGRADYYQIRDYTPISNSIVYYDSVMSTSLPLQLDDEGTHEFYVRAVCNGGESFSAWMMTTTFVWIPGKRCIDYMDIGISPQVSGRCYVGTYENFVTEAKQGTLQMVNNGPSSHKSLHALHTDLSEVDPNTTLNGGLSTVPDGEIASVRLGGMDSEGGSNFPDAYSSRIEYKYTVQAGMSDLLDLKYAAVLQSGGHEEVQQPSFKLDVLDGSGRQLASSCTHLDFKPGFGSTSSWHNEDDIYWCDWSTVTVSLRPYVGQTLTIRLTAVRCYYDTHFAYAYFTLGCRSGSLEGLACGDLSTDHFTAPEGFTYRWYKEGQPNTTLDTARTFHIDPLDANIYMVECHSVTDYSCYYVLTANPNPRFPMSQVTYKASVDNCQNIVDFSNSSFIRVVNRATGETMSEEEALYDIFYHYGDGTEEWVSGAQNRHIYPQEGGEFECYAVASMNDGVCQDTIRYTISLPDILHTGSQDTVHACVGDSVQIQSGEWVFRDTVYTTYQANQYGCQAPSDHYVFIHPVSYDSTVVELCEGGYVDFEGKRYTETGVYTVNLQTIHGCDSVLELMLTVIPRLEVAIRDTIEICADDSLIPIPYDVIKGRVSAVHVMPDSFALTRGFLPDYPFEPEDYILLPTPHNIHPGYYSMTISLGTPDCPSDPVYVVLKVKYSSSIIDQKNDIVALLNEDYNGGFTFLGYQWYRNDLPMIGETTSYVIVSDSDQGAKYYCKLIGDDGVVVETCPIWYTSGRTALDNVEVFAIEPTLVGGGGQICLNKSGLIRIFDNLGRQVKEYRLPVGEKAVIEAPAEDGLYIVVSGSEAAKIVVRN